MEKNTSIQVGVIGSMGRMGRAVCKAVSISSDLQLVAAVDLTEEGLLPSEIPDGVFVGSDLNQMVEKGVDVVVDFTTAEATRKNLPVLAEAGIHAVVGTSGLTEEDLLEMRGIFLSSNCVIVPNFAIGAALLMRFAEIASPWFDTAEIVEYHHDEKVDAPSGTAIATAERMAAVSEDWAPDPTTNETLSGSRGALSAAGIRIHAIRMRGMIAHQEVVLGTEGQVLTIRHDTSNRDSFMPGVLLAVREISKISGVTVGLETLLGI